MEYLSPLEGRHHGRLFHVGVEVNARLHAAQLRLALEIRIVEVLGLQPLALAVRRRQDVRVHQRRRGGRIGGAQRVLHPGLGELLLDAFERSHLPGGNAVVVTQQADRIVRRRADHRDFGTDDFKGRKPSWFFSSTMDSRSACRASWRCAAESFSEYGILVYGTRSGGSNMPRRIRATKRRSVARVISASVDRARLHFVDEARVLAAASEIRARLDGRHRRRALGGRVFVTPEDIADRAAIAHDVALKSPLIPQALFAAGPCWRSRARRPPSCRRTSRNPPCPPSPRP